MLACHYLICSRLDDISIYDLVVKERDTDTYITLSVTFNSLS